MGTGHGFRKVLTVAALSMWLTASASLVAQAYPSGSEDFGKGAGACAPAECVQPAIPVGSSLRQPAQPPVSAPANSPSFPLLPWVGVGILGVAGIALATTRFRHHAPARPAL